MVVPGTSLTSIMATTEFVCKKRHCRSAEKNCHGDAQECERLRLAAEDTCSMNMSCSPSKCPKSKGSKATSQIKYISLQVRKEGGLHTFRALLQCVWPKNEWLVRSQVVLSLLLLLTSKLLNIAVPMLLKVAVDHLTHINDVYFVKNNTSDFGVQKKYHFGVETKGDSGAPKDVLMEPKDVLMEPKDVLMEPKDVLMELAWTPVLVLVCYGLCKGGSAVLGELRNALFARVAYSSIRRIALIVFRHLHTLDLSFHVHRQTGALSKAIDRGSRGIATVLNALVFNVLPTILELALVTLILALKSGLVYAMVALGAVMIYVVFTLAVTRWRTKFRLKMNAADGLAGNKAVDSLINFETVKFFTNEQFEADEYETFMARFEKASIQTRATLSLLNAGQQVIFSAALTIVTILAALAIMRDEMSVGDLVMINGLLFQLSIPLNFLGSVYRDIVLALTDMEAMFDLTRTKPQVQNVCGSPKLSVCPLSSSVKFEHVSFEYTPGHRVLHDISFTINPSQRVGIVGASGSGKSTLMRLLFRLIDPTHGKVLINEQDIRHCDLRSVREQVSVVPQDTVLFHKSVMQNINYGDLTACESRVMRAASAAEVHEAIVAWPQGYATQVGERGLRLSGGEKQRISLARAMLKQAPILVLDEATSALDSRTEQDVMKTMHKATNNRTVFIIAHRLAAVVDCDLVIVLDKGRVVESGSYKELMENESSFFFGLWQCQHRAALQGERVEEEEEEMQLEIEERCEKMCCG